MRTLGLPWRELVLVVTVALGLAGSIAVFAATAPAFRAAVPTASAREGLTSELAADHSATSNRSRAALGGDPTRAAQTNPTMEEKSHDE